MNKAVEAQLEPVPGLRRLGLTNEDVALVRGLPLFQGLAEDVLAHLLGGGLVRSYERKMLLFAQGEEASASSSCSKVRCACSAPPLMARTAPSPCSAPARA